jgi:SEC-C motif-containing protein
MRSRYSAFALGLGAYLFDTLAASHPDREGAREGMIRELSRVRERQRFMGLTILHARASDDEGEVLFFARIFEKGQSASFGELSRFVREGGAWRYASGILVPDRELPDDVSTLEREGFLRIATALGVRALG